MSNELITQNDIAQALSKTLMDVAMGRKVEKSALEKQIDISDAINRRMQTKINFMKVMIEARKSGVDFAASMKEINTMVNETASDMALLDRVAE